MTYKLGIIGTTHYNNEDQVFNDLDRFVELHGLPSVIITSYDPESGVERIAVEWAKHHKIKCDQYPLDRRRVLLTTSNKLLAYVIQGGSPKTMKSIKEFKSDSSQCFTIYQQERVYKQKEITTGGAKRGRKPSGKKKQKTKKQRYNDDYSISSSSHFQKPTITTSLSLSHDL